MVDKMTAVILAGGQAKRAGGRLKTEILVEGKSIFSRMEEVLSRIFDDIIISANIPLEFPPYDKYTRVPDQITGKGPLGGIHSALKASGKSEAVFVFAGDMPFPDEEIIRDMISQYLVSRPDALIPQIGNFSEPLHGIYLTTLAEKIEKFLQTSDDVSVIGFLKTVHTEYFMPPDNEKARKAFTNINSLTDLFY